MSLAKTFNQLVSTAYWRNALSKWTPTFRLFQVACDKGAFPGSRKTVRVKSDLKKVSKTLTGIYGSSYLLSIASTFIENFTNHKTEVSGEFIHDQ